MIAGPNGAGKTTFFESHIRPLTAAAFVNADLLALERLGHHARTLADTELGQALADARRRELMAQAESFVAESTFSHPSKLELLRHARRAGYRVAVYHVSVRDPDLAVARTRAREAWGGHPVPEEKVRARYVRNQPIIREAVRLADRAFVFDNSIRGEPPRRLLTFRAGNLVQAAPGLPPWAASLYADDLRRLA